MHFSSKFLLYIIFCPIIIFLHPIFHIYKCSSLMPQCFSLHTPMHFALHMIPIINRHSRPGRHVHPVCHFLHTTHVRIIALPLMAAVKQVRATLVVEDGNGVTDHTGTVFINLLRWKIRDLYRLITNC